MPDPYNRHPLARGQFDARCARLEEVHPELSVTSGKRSATRNTDVGGHPASAHLKGLARDYEHDDGPDILQSTISDILKTAFTLGLYGLYHDAGSGNHFHFQSRAPKG